MRNDTVYEFSAGFAAFDNQIPVGGRYNYQRNKANMIRKFIVSFAVAFQDFFLPFFQAANQLLGSVVFDKFGINYKKIFSVADVLNRKRIEVAFSIRQMVNSIENIGFSNAVFAYKTDYFTVKFEAGFCEIFIIE